MIVPLILWIAALTSIILFVPMPLGLMVGICLIEILGGFVIGRTFGE